jgi:hypothetical protein
MSETTNATEILESIQGAEGSEAPIEAVEAVEAVEVPVEAPKPEEPKSDERFAAKFAALSRKERAIRQQEAKLQQKMADLEAKLKAFEGQNTDMDKYKSLPDRLKREPLKVLEEQGLSFEQLAQMVLENDGKPTPDMLLQRYQAQFDAKLREMEEKLQQKDVERAQAEQEAALRNFSAQLTDFVNQNSNDFELIVANGATDLVMDVITEHYNNTAAENDGQGEVLSNKQACEMVEAYLLEEAKKLIDREKVKKLLNPGPQKIPAPKSPTLSNAQAAQAPKQGTARKLSPQESLAEAAKLIRWEE